MSRTLVALAALPARYLVAVAVAAQGLGACVPPPEDAGALELTHFVQNGAVGVFLNETLVLQFDRELDAASVTSASASVRSVRGEPAAGEFEVQGYRLVFRPDAPRDRDLGDGGLSPDTVYELRLAGFPRPDGLRSRDGAVLARSVRLQFRTARLGGATPLFEDPTPDGALPLQLETSEIGPLDPIVLYSADPLDPTSLNDGQFALAHAGTVRSPDGGTQLVREEIPLRPLIAKNGPEGARLELWAAGEHAPRRSLAPGPYQLLIDPANYSLRDFGGNPVLPPVGDAGDIHRRIIVHEGTRHAQRIAVHHEPFLDTNARSPQRVAGTEGVAHWGSDGLVTVRLPRAVGDGRDGSVELDASETRRDLHAVRLSLAEGASVRLEPVLAPGAAAGGDGPIVLRSQGRMLLNGRLLRPSPGTAWERGPDESRTDWVDRAGSDWRSRVAPKNSQPLSKERPLPEADWPAFEDWLAALADSSEPWTVLIAGGDLEIGGRLRVDGPLMLVVGGWLRVTGSIEASQVWKLGDGGGLNVRPQPLVPALRVLAPTRNPLREEMTWAVLSAPHRPLFGVLRWHPARIGGQGEFRVRFLGERDRIGGGVEVLGPVEDPVLLADSDAVRARIELTVAPGGVWNPPLVDFVELAWDEAD